MLSDETLAPDTVVIGQKQHRRIAELPQIPPVSRSLLRLDYIVFLIVPYWQKMVTSGMSYCLVASAILPADAAKLGSVARTTKR